MEDDKPLSDYFNFDMKDPFTRTFVYADKWMTRAQKAEVIIANVRALLTTGPGSEARAGNDPGLIDVADGNVADGAEVADEEWRVAIRKALGE